MTLRFTVDLHPLVGILAAFKEAETGISIRYLRGESSVKMMFMGDDRMHTVFLDTNARNATLTSEGEEELFKIDYGDLRSSLEAIDHKGCTSECNITIEGERLIVHSQSPEFECALVNDNQPDEREWMEFPPLGDSVCTVELDIRNVMAQIRVCVDPMVEIVCSGDSISLLGETAYVQETDPFRVLVLKGYLRMAVEALLKCTTSTFRMHVEPHTPVILCADGVRVYLAPVYESEEDAVAG